MKLEALTGYRIIDLTDEKGTFCIKLLAGMGGEVVQIDATAIWEQSRSLIQNADILVESCAPGFLSSLGLGYAELKQINPRLIMASITNFGQTGPWRDFQSTELVSSALGGQMYVCGKPGRPPLKPFGPLTYATAGLFAANGILLALHSRRVSHQGQYIDISIHECVAATLDHVLVRYFNEGVVAERTGSLYWNKAFRVFPCRDGHVLLSLSYQWETLVEWLDAEGMADDLRDKRWLDQAERERHLDHITAVLEKWTLTHTGDALVEQGQLMRFPWAKVASVPDAVNNPQLKARGFFSNLKESP